MYIDPDSDKRPDKVFVSAVKKMQRREGSTLTAEETDAIQQWLPKRTTTIPWGSVAAPTAADFLTHLPTTGGGSLVEKNASPMKSLQGDMMTALIMWLEVLLKLRGCGQLQGIYWPLKEKIGN